jgi:two-component system LytT family sensor kinase
MLLITKKLLYIYRQLTTEFRITSQWKKLRSLAIFVGNDFNGTSPTRRSKAFIEVFCLRWQQLLENQKLWNPDMLKPNLQYLAFDDRWLILVLIPSIAILIPFTFFGIDLATYLKNIHQEFFESLTYTTIFWMFNRYLMVSLRKRYNAFSQTLKRFTIQSIIILLAVPIMSFAITGVLDAVFKLLGTKDLYEPTLFQGLSSTYILCFAITMLYDTIYFFHKYKEAIVEKKQIQLAHIQGQLENLRNQINPHFLFNSLNTLMNLIPTNPDRAMNYLDKLSRFYRYTVSNQEQQLVPLKTELENVTIYADLLKERFHEGIQISLPEEVHYDKQILPLCLQILIENAVKHNIVSKKNPLQVTLKNEDNYIWVENNIQKRIHQVKSTGMGLKNIRERMAFFSDQPLLVEENTHSFKVGVPLILSSK